MNPVVGRTVSVVGGDAGVSLADFRCRRAYVLLGDPGAGKTTAFGEECDAVQGAVLVSARRFLRPRVPRAGWRGTTLFIDGLDEVRVSTQDARKPLDRILSRLEELECPRFRLSCRAADWLGRTDLAEIKSVDAYSDVELLRLDPLGETQIDELLAGLGQGDSAEFVQRAHEHGVAGLLDNPLLLQLLKKAVDDNGSWPSSRFELLQSACQVLAGEHNDQHLDASRGEPTVSDEAIVDAGGELCALLLLSGKEFVSFHPAGPASLPLQEIKSRAGCGHALNRAIKSNLFRAHPEESDGFVPVHGQIAEFLGAGFISKRITEGGIPPARVLALMKGGDGKIVTALRGLAAWIAAFDKSTRSLLIEADPMGVVHYGDVNRLGRDELQAVLDSLEESSAAIDPRDWPGSVLAPLIKPAIVARLGDYLRDEERGEGHQTLVTLLLQGMTRAAGPENGTVASSSNGIDALDWRELEAVVRDTSWRSRVRHAALRAMVLRGGDGGGRDARMVSLLHALREGSVGDPDGQLRGILLAHLYPRHVRREEVWDHLRARPPGRPGTEYASFWTTALLEQTAPPQIVPLVRSFAKQEDAADLYQSSGSNFRHLIEKLVIKALRSSGESPARATPACVQMDVKDVCAWLDLVGFWEYGDQRSSAKELSGCLAERPDLQKELALYKLRRILSTEAADKDGLTRLQSLNVYNPIFRSDKPGDLPRWCLERVLESVATDMRLARELLEWLLGWILRRQEGPSDDGISIDDVQSAVAHIPALRERVADYRAAVREGRRDAVQWQADQIEADRARERERRRREEAWIALVEERLHNGRLGAGSCEPSILHQIAESYCGRGPVDRDKAPRQRVLEGLGGREDLADAAMEGLRRVVDRGDLPSLRDLIRLGEQGKVSLLALPLLAAYDLADDLSWRERAPAEIERAAGLYYLTPSASPGHPQWYLRALEHHPEAIADGLIKVTRSQIRHRLHALQLRALASKSHRRVAELAVIRLLNAFPTRCAGPQVEALHQVLAAALTWDVDGLGPAVAKRLDRDDLDVAQRALLLAAGLVVAPEDYASMVAAFVEGGEEARLTRVIGLLASIGSERRWRTFATQELKGLIELVGRGHVPWWHDFGHGFFDDVEARDGVPGQQSAGALLDVWAATLASRTDEDDARQALQSLAADPRLAAWQPLLAERHKAQTEAWRTASLGKPDPAKVQETLRGGPPANAADLAALVADHLESLGRRIAKGNTDDWRQYWNACGQETTGRRHENHCRDFLLSDLQMLLQPINADAQPEGPYARDGRADIRVSCGEFAIPVEIKKNFHAKLWSAINDQLAYGYATAPESCGFGIYLVLWFGPEGPRSTNGKRERTPPAPTGRRPASPEELRVRLEEQLAESDRHRITVVVIDVSGQRPGWG